MIPWTLQAPSGTQAMCLSNWVQLSDLAVNLSRFAKFFCPKFFWTRIYLRLFFSHFHHQLGFPISQFLYAVFIFFSINIFFSLLLFPLNFFFFSTLVLQLIFSWFPKIIKVFKNIFYRISGNSRLLYK